jgi:hypothetical protein
VTRNTRAQRGREELGDSGFDREVGVDDVLFGEEEVELVDVARGNLELGRVIILDEVFQVVLRENRWR